MYILLDANVTAGYYLPRCLASKRASDRITTIFDSVRSGGSRHFFYIPNFCIAEVFSTFMKYTFSEWNPTVRARGTIDTRVFRSLVRQFQSDIHNGRFLYQYELSRYHILATNLVGPIDHYFKIRRSRQRRVIPMGTFDHLIVAMGIHLAHIHGPTNVAILSADDRLTDVLTKCKSAIPARTIRKLKLEIAEEVTGRPFSRDLFPQHLNLKSATVAQLRDVFGQWPLPVVSRVRAYRWLG